MDRISIIGCGRLGLVFSLLCESRGYFVYGCDTRKDYVEQLNNKTYRTSEPEIEDLLHRARKFTATTDIREAIEFSDLLFVFVPTPSKPNGEYDHQHIEEVVQDLVSYHLDGGEIKNKTLVICCTVMPTYCKDLQERLVKYGYGVNVVYNPEFVAQSQIVHGLKNADIVLMGGDIDFDFMILFEVYKRIMDIEPKFKLLTHTSAEITKISINCYLTMKVAFANMCGEVAINSGEENSVKEILEAIGSDKRIGNKFLNYGFPASGICLPRDMRALEAHMENIGLQNDFIDGIVAENERHLEYIKAYYISKNPDKNFPFIFNQLTYKPGVEILTESQHYQLCKELLHEGYSVNINESESVINAVKPELEMYGDKVTYGNGIGTHSRFEGRLVKGQSKKGFIIDL